MDIGATELIGVLGQVSLAGLFWDTVPVGIDVHFSGVAAVAGSSSLAVDNDLGGKVELRPSVVSGDVDPVSDGAGGSVSPARAAVDGDVLVAAPRKIVSSADVAPEPGLGKGLHIKVLVRPGGGHVLLVFFVRFPSAGALFLGEELLGHGVSRVGLGLISEILGPSVSGGSPRASGLNTKVVLSSDQPEVTLFTPVASPRVSDDPVLDSVLLSPSHNRNVVVEVLSAGLVLEDTAGVVDEFLGDGDGASDRASLVDLVDHVLFSHDISVFVDSVDLGAFLSPTSLAGEAVLALDFSSATNTIVMTVSLVGGAGFIGDVVVVDPFVSGPSITAVAAFVGEFAGDQNLRRQVDIGELGFTSNFDSVAQSGGGREGPAGSAVDGDVLVPLVGEEVGAIDVAPEEVGWELVLGEGLEGSLDVGAEVFVVDVAPVLGDVDAESAEQEQSDDRN